MSSGKTRHIYYAGNVPMIDVFFDKLDYCHEVSYKDRLELDEYSVSLSDIMLQKLQIWEINDKDLKDIEYLLTTAEIGDDDDKKINQTYIAQRLRRRLGLLVHGDDQLRPRQGARRQGRRARPRAEAGHRQDRCDQFLARIEAEPKTKGWNKRAKKGTDKTLVQHQLLRLVSLPPGVVRAR